MLTTNSRSQKQSQSPSEVRLVEVLDAYLAAAQEGTAPARDALLAEYPELAEDLEACLASLEFIRQASLTAPPLVADEKAVAAGEGETETGIGELGDFRLIAEVGRGGMGVVYEAVQRSLNRRVALKVLPFAAAMDPTQLRRFQTEALAAAQLHHTHIVPVYSVGCERGVHYYAMQFIEGQTLAQAIAERRRLDEPPTVQRDPSSSPPRGEGGPKGGMRGQRKRARRGSPGTRSIAADPADRRSPFVRRGSSDPAGMPDRRSPASGGADDKGRPSVTKRAGSGDPRPTNDPADRWSPDSDTSSEPPPPPVQTVRSATPSPSSRTREYCQTAAALGIQAAEALDHAHKLGIVHRDVKPANLLLDVQGNLWVTDFGLARLQDDAGLTITGDLLGTLRYMSPEQALAKRGYLDHRTDIYSLGVTLYELVTLRPAVDGQDRQEVLRKIAQDEPAPPRQLNPAIPRELETILLKAMNKEPESRYATAQELADDLRRFLEDKPIKARRPTAWEHVVKWSRRHKSLVGSAVAVLVLVVVGMAIGMVLLARKQAELERQRDAARQAVDDMYTNVAQDWLAQRAALEPMQQKFLEKALDYYRRFAGESSTEPKVQLKTAVAYRRVGDIQKKLGRYREAEAVYRRAMAMLEKLLASAPPAPEYYRELAAAHTSLGGLLMSDDRHTEAEPLFRRAVDLTEKLAAESPSDRFYQEELATDYNDLGSLFFETGRLQDAEPMYHRAIALREKLVEGSPSATAYRRSLAQTHHNHGFLLAEMGRSSEAESAYGRSIALCEKVAEELPFDPSSQSDLAEGLDGLGILLAQSGRPMEAEPLFERAIALGEKLVAGSPSVPLYLSNLSDSYCNLSGTLKGISRFSDAEKASRRAIGLKEKLLAASPSSPLDRFGLAMSQGFLAEILEATGQHAAAAQAFHRVIPPLEALATESPSVPRYQNMLATTHYNLSRLLSRTGSPGESEEECRRAINILEKMADAGSQNYLAWILATNPDARLRDPQRALRTARTAVEQNPKASGFWNTLGVAHYRVGDWKHAIEALEKSTEPGSGASASAWFFLAMARWQSGQKDQARQSYDRAVDSMEKNHSQDYELRRFRAEASALLGVTDNPTPAGRKEETPTRHPSP